MKMQTAITTKQAREICKGRTPLIPVEYETAVKALAECVTLDEAKYWDNKADALAAWAKIYHSSEAERKAKQLKLHAYRRMGQLAGELRPKRMVIRKGLYLGPEALLRENGLSDRHAGAARSLALMPAEKFVREIERARPRSPMTVVHWRSGERTAAYPVLMTARSGLRNLNPTESAKMAVASDQTALIACVRELIDWLDAFEQALPRAKP